MKSQDIYLIVLLIQLTFTSTVHSKIVINEIMYRPITQDSDDEYIEIYNAADAPVDLSNWSFNQGINYKFPFGTVLNSNDYLVISPNPSQFEQTYSNSNALGPFDGKLNNNGETISLINQNQELIDSVTFSSEQGWAIEADGFGSSLERIHPDMSSSAPQSWNASPPGGTPWLVNQSAIPLPHPVVTFVNQSIASPQSSDEVNITVQITSHNSIVDAQLYYKSENDSVFQPVALIDDGTHQDGSANDGIYGARIPAFPNSTIVEFYAAASDAENQLGMYPNAGKSQAAIYLVNDDEFQTELPLYRIIMRTRDEQTLRRRDPRSDDELLGSFVAGNSIYHNVMIRFRGKGSRNHNPKNYRVNFSNTRYFNDIRKLNLNIVEPDRQFIGLESFKAVGLPAPESQPVSLLFNKAYVPNYLQVERIDREMVDRSFGDGGGNIYRGIEQANLDYRGEDPNNYRIHYTKETNEREDDFTDLIRMSEVFSLAPDETFAQDIAEHINVQQWVRWFALKQILNDLEGGLSKDRGDDYYMYNNPNDDRFYLLPWDMDSVLVDPISEIHHHGTPAIRRMLKHPDIARFYYKEILNLLDNELTTEVMNEIIDRAAPLSNPGRLDFFRNIYQRLRQFHYDRIPRVLTAEVSRGNTGISTSFIQENNIWQFFRGRSEPAGEPLAWTRNEYDDSNWESGPGGIGYGDGDDRTVLNDMRNNYTTVFTRAKFQINDPTKFARLNLNIIVDDGFVAYVNGIEIARHNFNGTPTFRSTAAGSFEANTPLSFSIPVSGNLLQAGDNTLAVVGLNTNITSSDLTLRVALDGVEVSNDIVQLNGVADAANTRWIRVNGELADFIPWQATWSYNGFFPQGRNCVLVEAYDALGNVIESKHTTVYVGVQEPTDGNEICGDVVWSSLDGPVVVDQNIIVPKGESLTIAPGSLVQMAPNTSIIVYGTLRVNGTENEPVKFEPAIPGTTWGSIAIDGTETQTVISHADIIGAAGTTFRNKQYPGAITVRSSRVLVEGCSLFGTTSIGGLFGAVDADQSTMTIRGNRFHTTGEAVHCNNSFSIIENNYFENVIGSNDAIDLDGQMGEPSIITGNTFIDMENDAIDTGYASAIIEQNFIMNCGDKGISLEGTSEVIVNNNVIINTVIGIAIKDQCFASIVHNTIVRSGNGIWAYEKNAGRGGGIADVVNTVVWDAEISIAADALSTLTVQSSNFNILPNEYQTNNVSVAPLFVDPANLDFHLRSDSPLIDAGISTNVAVDYDNKQRPLGSSPDIGAFEYDPATNMSEWSIHSY